MPKQVKIEFFSDGFKQILCSGGTAGCVEGIAKGIQSRANAALSGASQGFSCRTWTGSYGGGRVVASVSTTDHETCVAEAENKALSKAVRG